MPDRDRSQLPPMDVAGRLGRLRERLDGAGCDALLVTSLHNVRYLTGFTGSSAMLLVTNGNALLVTDGRYRDQAREQLTAAGAEVEVEIGRPAGQLEALDRATKGIGRLGAEQDNVSWGEVRRFQEALGQLASSAGELVATRGLVEGLRVVKDEGELGRIEAAADIADVALAQVKERMREGLTEAQFAMELDYEMRRRGADDVSFETIVASGPNGAMPHARPTDRRIEEGETVVIDFGALVDGYHSDMTRTLTVDRVRDPQLDELLDAVLIAQRAGVRTVRAGAEAAEVDGACRQSLQDAGLGDLFVHGTGHGVGLQIHEAPALGIGTTDILQEGSVVTVEPGAYLPGVGGVRIEDTLVVTASGARALTKSTKDTTL
jgi:Xaa-Pro aminopeptidase